MLKKLSSWCKTYCADIASCHLVRDHSLKFLIWAFTNINCKVTILTIINRNTNSLRNRRKNCFSKLRFMNRNSGNSIKWSKFWKWRSAEETMKLLQSFSIIPDKLHCYRIKTPIWKNNSVRLGSSSVSKRSWS